jgi:hypothetical protein
MPDSIIAICNRAISEIGGGTPSQITTLADGSVEAAQCNLWYDRLRRNLLRTAPWGFARFQETLTQVGDLIPDQTAPYPFLWAYAYPSDCIKFRYILPPPVPPITGAISPPLTGDQFVTGWMAPSRRNRYLVQFARDGQGNQSRQVISNVQQAIGVYTVDVTDPDVFDDLFIEALQAALSYKLVIPLSGNIAMKADFKAAAELAITQARAADANEAIPTTDIKVDWIETRGVGSAYGFAPWSGVGWGQWNCGWDEMNWGS